MKRLIALVVVLLFGTTSVAFAQTAPDTQAQINALQKQLDAVKAQLDALKAQKPAAPAAAAAAPTSFLALKPGNEVTFIVGGKEEVTVYGNLDLSLDSTTKGLHHSYPVDNGAPVTGAVGNLFAISSNLSYIGVRGSHKLSSVMSVPYQLETQIDIPSTAGTVNTNSNNDAIVKGALTSRNSFVGIADKYVGALKIGKTDAPYKTSTARMNPFNGHIGDYAVVMGNTGGDNRVEFGTRLDHSLWYESPNWHGLAFNALWSPGQNRAFDNSLIPIGEASCAGGNAPGSGALPPACNDGSWGDVYSTSLNYQANKRLYVTAAYEMHKRVNRSSDVVDPTLAALDVGDEQALKYGFQWTLPRTTISGIYEKFDRYVPAVLTFQNERSRDGFWLALTQTLNPRENISFGWARANPTPGDPGQHNTAGGLNPDNMANMYTAMIRHTIDRHFSVYADYAMTLNHPDAHYDLGAGGRGLTTDCHDGSQLAALDPTTGTISGSGPHCYAGGLLRGVSVGMNLRF